MQEVGRNDPCPCGSGEKYKKCCMGDPNAKLQQQKLSKEQIALLILRAKELYVTKKDLLSAAKLCHEVLRHAPREPRALFLTGAILHDGGQYDKAIGLLEAAISEDDRNADYWSYLARCYQSVGLAGKAILACQKAIDINPKDDNLYNVMGVMRFAANDARGAIAVYNKALELNPKNEMVLKNLIMSLQEIGEYKEADEVFKKIIRLNPKSLDRVGYALFLPRIISSREEIKERRESIRKSLEAFIAEGITVEDPSYFIKSPPFYLAYHALNDKELLQKHSEFFLKAIKPLNYEAPHCRPGAVRLSGKIRIGFISAYFLNHPVGMCFNDVINSLASSNEFEIYLITTEGKKDEKTEKLISNAKHIALPKIIDHSCSSIAQLNLDILVYADIGMNNTTYFLAHTRLAPIQCVLAGHPNTTGIPNMDYFISMRGMEPQNCAEHYSEQLLLIDRPPVSFMKPAIPDRWMTREELGLPTDKNLYAVPMTIQKLHPDFDHVMAEILRRDENGLIILFEDPLYPDATRTLMKRLQVSMSDVASRGVFMRFLPKEKFLHFIHNCDVMLDPFHFGGGTTGYYIFAVGTPNITWPGNFMRSRVMTAIYEWMGVTDVIAKDWEDYIQLAVKCGTNPEFREKVRQKILAKADMLYGDTGIVAEITQLFKDLAAGRIEKYAPHTAPALKSAQG